MKRKLFVALAVSLCAMQMKAEVIDNNNVTIDSCRVWAERNYPMVEQYELIAQSADYSIQNAARSWIPQVNVSAMATYQNATANMNDMIDYMQLSDLMQTMGITVPDMYMRKGQGKVQLDVQQNIWDGGKSKSEKNIAKADARQQSAEIDVNMYELQSRIDNIYFGILLLDEQIEQMNNTLSLLETNMKRVKSLFDNEMALQSDIDAVEVEILTLGQRQEQLRHSVAAFRMMLSLLTAHDMTAAKLQLPAELDATLIATTTRPELRLLDAKRDFISAKEKNVKTYSMPQFAAFAQGWYGYPGLDMFKSMCSYDPSLNAVVGLRMQWVVGAYYTQGNTLRKLRNMQEQIRVQQDVFLLNQKIQITQENAEIARLKKALEDDGRIVELRRNVRQAAETKYENGTITTTELMQKINDEQNAASARALHRVELIKKQYELQHIQ